MINKKISMDTSIKQKREIFKQLQLITSSEAANMLGWPLAKFTTYKSRGQLPKPLGSVGGRPVWTKEQIENYIKGL